MPTRESCWLHENYGATPAAALTATTQPTKDLEGRSLSRSTIVPPLVFDCDAVLFDMDGTLVDSRALVERMWLRWANRRGVSAEAILAVAHGRRTLETMQIVAPQFATPDEAAALDTEEEEEARTHGGETAVPGAALLLHALPPDRWAIVTSAVADIARRRVAGVGLPVPRLLVGAGDVDAGKPDPEGYLRAAYTLGFDPARCIVVEDTPAGVQAGRAAGAQVIGMLTTYTALDGCAALVRDLRTIEVGRDPWGALQLRVAETAGESPA